MGPIKRQCWRASKQMAQKNIVKHPFGVVRQRSDEKWLLDLELPRQRAFSLPDQWSPASVLRVNEEMLKHVASKAGRLESFALAGQLHKGLDLPPEEAFDLSEGLFFDTVDSWKKPMTMLADNSFSKMLLAAALTAPSDQLKPDEIIAPSGTVYLQEPLSLSPLYEDLVGNLSVDPKYLELVSEVPARAIHWGEMGFGGIGVYLLADGMTAAKFEEAHTSKGESKDNPLSPIEFSRCLTPITFSPMLWGIEEKPHATTGRLIALMRALKAILDSPISSSTRPSPLSVSKKRRGRLKKPLDVSQIRLISLRRPDDADEELNAVTGVKQRAHWVRGHWRRHWYPKAEEHHSIWIEGYAKGNPNLGVISDKRVYLAKGDPEEGDSKDSL